MYNHPHTHGRNRGNKMSNYGSRLLKNMSQSQSMSSNSFKNGIFGGGVIIEEIEVDERGNFLGKSYKILRDKRPNRLLANPYNYNDMNAYFTPEDVLDMGAQQGKLQAYNKEIQTLLKGVEKEKATLRAEKEEVKRKEQLIREGRFDELELDSSKGGYNGRRGRGLDLSSDDSSLSDTDDDLISSYGGGGGYSDDESMTETISSEDTEYL